MIEEGTLEWEAEWAASGLGLHALRFRLPYDASGEKILIDETATVSGG